MKQLDKALAAILIMAASCTQLPVEDKVTALADECVLTVDFSSPETKLTGQNKSKEDAINNVSIFVFRTDDENRLDAADYINVSPADTQAGNGNPYSHKLTCTVGPRKVYAVANMPSDIRTKILKESDLLECNSLLTDNGPANFFMMGSTTENVSGGEFTVKVRVSRKVASVRIDKITNLMEAVAYRADGMFVVNKVYLTNAVGVWKFDGTTKSSAVASDYWLAKLSAQNNNLIYDDNINSTVNYDKAYTTSHTFYAYPNDCTVSESVPWTPRSTMLVVEASLNGKTYYYPVEVGPLESNKQYVITDFIIRRPGSLKPWEMVHKSTATINVVVEDWGTPVERQEEI